MFKVVVVLLLVCRSASLSVSRRRSIRSSPESECGEIKDNTLHSPNYPRNYPTNTHCMYTIPVHQNTVLNLKFVDFDMEDSSDCSYDYVEVRDNEQSYGKYCGRSLRGSNIMLEDTPYVNVIFHSDKSLSKRGFHIKYDYANKHGSPNEKKGREIIAKRLPSKALTTPETTTPETTTPEQTTPEPTTPEQTTPKPTTPKQTTPEPTTPEQTTPEQTTPEQTTPEQTTPEPTTPEQTTPEQTEEGPSEVVEGPTTVGEEGPSEVVEGPTTVGVEGPTDGGEVPTSDGDRRTDGLKGHGSGSSAHLQEMMFKLQLLMLNEKIHGLMLRIENLKHILKQCAKQHEHPKGEYGSSYIKREFGDDFDDFDLLYDMNRRRRRRRDVTDYAEELKEKINRLESQKKMLQIKQKLIKS